MNLEHKELQLLKDALVSVLVLKKDQWRVIDATEPEIQALYCRVCNEFDDVKKVTE